MFCQLVEFPLLGHFNLGLVERFAYQSLEDRLRFKVEIENRICLELALLVNAVKLRHEDRIWSHINEKIRFNCELINLLFVVRQRFPILADTR